MKWVYDDGGREAAGYKGAAGDCCARAFAIAMQRPYREVYDEFAKINAGQMGRSRRAKAQRGKRSARNGVFVTCAGFKRWLKEQGWEWVPCMKIGQGCTVHLADGELPMGRIVARVSRHVCAVIDGVVRDTWDPQRTTVYFDSEGNRTHTSERCVYGYYRKAS